MTRNDDSLRATAKTGAPACREMGHPLYRCLADPGSLVPFGDDIPAANPGAWPGYEEQLGRARQAAGSVHAVTTGVATVAGEPCVIAGFDFSFLGGSMGVAEGARLTRAFSVAAEQSIPVVCVAESGGVRVQEGTSALVQMQAVAAAITAAGRAGIPHIAIAGDPTTGGVWASVIASADVLLAMRNARVSFSGSRTRPVPADASAAFLADTQWAGGFADALLSPHQLRSEAARIIRLLSPRSRGQPPAAELVPPAATQDVAYGGGKDGWSQVTEARKPSQARAQRWLAGYFTQTFEIRGDRCGGVDDSLRCGFGSRNGRTIAYIAPTGQPVTPAGFRTALRLLHLAERYALPVLILIDTPGAAAAPSDEAAGLGNAIAELLIAVASCQVPVTSIVIGQGGSGGALALAAPANLWMAPDSYLAVTAPELAASILKLPASDVADVANRLRLTPSDLIRQGIARGTVDPPT